MKNFENFYNKNYKKSLIIPAILLVLSLAYLGFFYVQNGDLIRRDVSLTGGTTITVFSDASPEELQNFLSTKLTDFEITSTSDVLNEQSQIIITAQEESTQKLKDALEEFLGEPLDEQNSSIETTSSSLSSEFYKQLIVAILLAFFWMAAVVFTIFARGKKIKFWVILLNILLGFFLGLVFFKINLIISISILVLFSAFLIYTYIKKSVPAFAVMLSAFADIVMTLALVNLLGMKISSAGIVAFLMLIGYSVDTDIMLTARVLKRKTSEKNTAIFGAFKTGTTMTITSIIAVATALIVVFPFATILNQIFTILLIGLGFDILNTWLTNASIIKWYSEKK